MEHSGTPAFKLDQCEMTSAKSAICSCCEIIVETLKMMTCYSYSLKFVEQTFVPYLIECFVNVAEYDKHFFAFICCFAE